MAKKENLNPVAGLVFGGQAAYSQAPLASPAPLVAAHLQPPAQSFGEARGTQGRKGCKLPRINMAFSPENHAHIKRTARQLGISATEYVNSLVDGVRGG